MAGYDGTIKIDTSVDSKGMNRGTKSISSSLGGVLTAVKGIGAAMGLAFSGVAVFNFVKRTLESFNLMSSSVGQNVRMMQDGFSALRGAIANALIAALVVLMPYIIVVVNWLTRLFTIAAQLIGILFGVQTGMGAIADNSNAAAGGQAKLAKETKKAAKEARGALAAFDQLNVLQQPDPGMTAPDAPAAPSAGGAGGGLALPEMEVFPGLAEKFEAFKTKMLIFLQPVIDAFGRLKESLIPLGQTIWAGIKWAWDNILVPLGEWAITDLLPAFLDLLAAAADLLNEALIALGPIAQEFFDNFLKPLGQFMGDAIVAFLGFLADKLKELAAWIKENPEKFQNFVKVLGVIAAIIGIVVVLLWAFVNAGTVIVITIIAIIAIILNWGAIWEWLKLVATEVWKDIQSVWSTAMQFFAFTGKSIESSFYSALDGVKNKFETVFNGIKSFVIGIVNGIISTINGMVSAITAGINSVISGANAIGSVVPGFSPIAKVAAPKIPKLATGAVIPPNSEFAAILGDQKSGRNIEAPEGLIRQIVSEEIGKIQAEISIRFDGDLGALVRELKPRIDKENVRVGGSLIRSGVTSS